MRSDPSQGGDCCWAFATAVYSRTSDRSGMCLLWYSLGTDVQVVFVGSICLCLIKAIYVLRIDNSIRFMEYLKKYYSSNTK